MGNFGQEGVQCTNSQAEVCLKIKKIAATEILSVHYFVSTEIACTLSAEAHFINFI